MARNINLNSTDWCDIIFENKNKEYGAYAMRKTSSNRHLMAFGFVVLFTAAIASIPKLMDIVTPLQKKEIIKYDEKITITDITLDKPKEEIIYDSKPAPPKQSLAKSIKHTPPIITEDEKVTADNEFKTQEELKEFDGLISTHTVETDNKEGLDPRDVNMDAITGGDGTGGSGVIDFAEEMPQYPGGTSELMRYLSKNIKYPIPSAEAGVQGRVLLKFVVKKDGSISDVHILKGLDPLCDKEAIRVVNTMSRWIPGKQNGNAVAVYFTLPILFQLQK